MTLHEDAANQVMAGQPRATDAVRATRLETCRSCKRFDKRREHCRECGCLAHVKAAYAEETCPLDKWGPSSPSLVNKAIGFARAAAAHVTDGLVKVDPATLEERLAICRSCEQYDPSGTCFLCGCNLAIKASWRSSACPIKRW